MILPIDELLVGLGFFVFLPLLAAMFPVLDTIINEQLSFKAASRSKEFWILWVIYAAAALCVILVLDDRKTLEYNVLGFLGVFLGFPMLLQSKLFSYRDSKGGADTSVGFEFVLGIVNRMLVPGMKVSINEWIATLQEKWLKLDPTRLGDVIKNYVTTSNATKTLLDMQTMKWIDDLVLDSVNNSNNKDDNLRALFFKVMEVGGSRGVDYVIKRCG